MRRTWRLPVLAALLGAALPWLLLELIHLTDEGGWNAPGALEGLFFGLWIMVALPAAVVPGPSDVGVAGASLFWAFMFAWGTRTMQERRARSALW